MPKTEPLFYLKQTNESCIIKDGKYSYIAECHFTKDGKKQIWRYESTCNEKVCNNEFKRIL